VGVLRHCRGKVVGGEPCGAVRHKVHHVHPLNVLLPQHRDWSSEF